MSFCTNFPLFSIVMSLMTGVLCAVLNKKAAKILQITVVILITLMSLGVLIYTLQTGTYFIYRMGHYFAPFGNEVRAGVLEGMMATFFSIVMLLSLIGGDKYIERDIEGTKVNLFYSLTSLLMSSLLALTYTNDLFTAYVFVEINTLAACGLIAVRGSGKALLSAVKYMIMSLVGSGLLLISIALLYDITGHLLMQNLHAAIVNICETGAYTQSLIMVIGLMTCGLAIKSALFPFHAWLPDAYGNSTAASSSILSSLVSKAYIFLLLKLFVRVVGFEVIVKSGITDVLFVFGIVAMILGSVIAICQKDIKRMVAYSSVAQIGYIFMGFGIGVTAGLIAAVYHIFMHASSKSALFLSLEGLSEASGDSSKLSSLKGAGKRNRMAGIVFTIAGLSMVGIPLLPGFVSKICFGQAGVIAGSVKMYCVLAALVISTALNVIYFFRVILKIYEPSDNTKIKAGSAFNLSMLMFIVLNFVIGCFGVTMINWITDGLNMF